MRALQANRDVRVLICDDNPVQRASLVECLSEQDVYKRQNEQCATLCRHGKDQAALRQRGGKLDRAGGGPLSQLPQQCQFKGLVRRHGQGTCFRGKVGLILVAEVQGDLPQGSGGLRRLRVGEHGVQDVYKRQAVR